MRARIRLTDAWPAVYQVEETLAACRTTSGSVRVPGVTRFCMAPKPTFSKPCLPVQSHLPGWALPLRIECPPYGRAIPRRLPFPTYINCSRDSRAQCTNANGQNVIY